MTSVKKYRDEDELGRTKLEIIKWVAGLKDKKAIRRLELLKRGDFYDWWDTTPDAVKEAIREGLKDVEAGRTVSHASIRKLYGKWL